MGEAGNEETDSWLTAKIGMFIAANLSTRDGEQRMSLASIFLTRKLIRSEGWLGSTGTKAAPALRTASMVMGAQADFSKHRGMYVSRVTPSDTKCRAS